jgi:hypothetical protein
MLYLLAGSILALWLLGLLPTKARRMLARSQWNGRARRPLVGARALAVARRPGSGLAGAVPDALPHAERGTMSGALPPGVDTDEPSARGR